MKLLSSKGIYNSDELMTLSEILEKVLSNCNKKKAFGSNIYINDALNWRNQGIAMVGNITQVQTEGKQLFDKSTATVLNASISNNALASSSTEKIVYIKCEPNTTYTLSKLVNSPYSRNTIAETTELPNIGVAVQNISTDASASSQTYTTSATAQYIVWVCYNTSSTNYTLQQILDSIMIELGSTATSYEAYTNGKPTPAPDNQSNIIDVTGTQTIKTGNKNLFDITSTFPTTNNGVTFTKNNDGTITLNGTATTTFTKTFTLENQLLNGTYSLKHNVINGTQSAPSYFTIFDSNNNKISDRAYGGATAYNNLILENTIIVSAGLYITNGTKFDNYTVGTQLEPGSTATDYTPHKSQNKTLHLGDIHLRGIGDYEDIIFCNEKESPYYDSTLDEGAWYLHKKIGEATLDGSENWNMYTPQGYGPVAYCDFSGYLKVGGLTTMCNYYQSVNNVSGVVDAYNRGNNTISVINSSTLDRIYLRDDNISSLTDFKAWLSEKTPVLLYVIETPTFEKITDTTLLADLAELKKMQTYKGGTVISVTPTTGNPAQLEVTYLKDDRVEQAEEISNIKSALLSLGAEI